MEYSMIFHDEKVNMVTAITAINPDAQIDVSGPIANTVNYNSINWNKGTPIIPKADIDAKIIELEAEWVAQEYSRERKAEYAALNQMELIADDAINGTSTLDAAITAIKTKWPKDNSGPIE